MATAHRARIKNLLRKGRLTGFETARIVMSQLYTLEKIAQPELFGLEGIDTPENYREACFLTVEEIDAIKNGNLKGHNDRIEEYNNWIGAFPSFLSIIYCAHVNNLQIQDLLSFPMELLQSYLNEVIFKFDRMRMPDIVTEKQYQDLKNEQRKNMLKEKHKLGWVLYWRAKRVAQKEFGEDCMKTLLEDYPGRAINAYHQACSDILSLLKEGKLYLTYQEDIVPVLDDVLNKKSDKEILALIDCTISVEPKRKPEKPEPLLESMVKVKDLYRSGLPEWLQHVDEYRHNYGKSAPYDVAIIKNPSPDIIDEKGYYRKKDSFADQPYLGPPDASFWKSCNQSPRKFLTGQLLETKYYISLFLFRRSLLKVVSEVTGIDFCDQVSRWYDEIKCALSDYEDTFKRVLTVSDRARRSLTGALHAINLEELQVSPKLEEKFREILSKPLETEKWVSVCHMDFLEEMKEKQENGVFIHLISPLRES